MFWLSKRAFAKILFHSSGSTARLLNLERYNREDGSWTVILRRVATFDVQSQFMYASIYKSDHPASEVSANILS